MSRDNAVRTAAAFPGDTDGPGGIQREAFLYHGEFGFISATRDFVLAGLAADEAVMVAVTQPRIRQLRAALGSAADRVSFVDMAELGRNPARIIPAWQDFLDACQERGRQARGVGEPMWPGRGDPELSECRLHEFLLNHAFAASPHWVLRCPYDAGGLEAAVVEDVWHTHPRVIDRGFARVSERYRTPSGWRRHGHPQASAATGTGTAAAASAETGTEPGLLAEALPDLGIPQVELAFLDSGLSRVRAAVTAAARDRGIRRDRVGELELAVHEIATNSVRHGGGRGLLRIWADADRLVCEIRDGGRLSDPLAGRRRPGPSSGGGRGLWLANQLCDLVQLRSNRFGTVVRMHLYA